MRKWGRLLLFLGILISVIIATFFVIRSIFAQFSPQVNTSVIITGSSIGILLFDVIPFLITTIRLFFRPVRVPQSALAVAMIMLILVIIVGSITLVAAVHPDQTNAAIPSPRLTPSPTQDNTQASQATATAFALVQVTATALTQATADAQATAQAQDQATATVIAANPDPSPFGGSLVLLDPLHTNATGSRWDIGSKYGDGKRIGMCSFTSGTYHVTSELAGYFNDCFEKSVQVQNFVAEVQMRILQGDCGGLLFRANPGASEFYNWTVCQDGSWDLYAYFNASNGESPLQNGTFSPQNINTLAVAANGSQITLYSNGQSLITFTDTSFSSGVIGVTATNHRTMTDVAYSTLRVWALSS